MSPYRVLLHILEFFPARLAILPYGHESNVTKLLVTTNIIIIIIIKYGVPCSSAASTMSSSTQYGVPCLPVPSMEYQMI